jgi:DNA processing protein
MMSLSDVQAHAAALTGLPGMTPARLAKLLDGFHPELAWKALRTGAHPADPRRKFTESARMTDVRGVGARYAHAGVRVLLPHMVGYPTMLVGDPGAPAVLFALGDPAVLEGKPRVAIVGTRSATHYGRQVASELAGDLACEGVVVVSGLARGIDGAAHAGTVRAAHGAGAPPVAVVGTGLDVVYPSSNRELWEQVATRGAVLSESALGTKPHPGVFPARNRIIAALSDVVVVVESHYNGGSLYTAEAAARRSIPVCVVPGSVRSRASEGTNGLLVDGCTPVRDATDVMVAISLARAGTDELRPEDRTGRSRNALNRPGTDRQESNQSAIQPEAGKPEAGTPETGKPETGKSEAGQSGVSRLAIDLPDKHRRSANGRSMAPAGAQASAIQLAPTAVRNRRVPDRADLARTASQRAVWDAVDDTPTAFETILIRTDLSIVSAAEACDELVERGALKTGAGWWSRRKRE